MAPLDTGLDARRRQLDVYRAMSPAQRVEIAFEMSEEAFAITLGGIRARDPRLDHRQAVARLIEVTHGLDREQHQPH